MDINDLDIVNYSHRSCSPLKNIMRLPREQAFALAHEMAQQNKDTTAFYRFKDFENYYPERLETDRLLYAQFVKMGGAPKELHPLSFVLHGSEFLDRWFDNGIVTRIPLARVPAECVSFTYGDSMSVRKKCGKFTMLTKDMLLQTIAEYHGTVEEFLHEVNSQYHYMEVQLWDSINIPLPPGFSQA